MVDLKGRITETPNAGSRQFSSMSVAEAVTLMNEEDTRAVSAVAQAKGQIVHVIEQSKSTLENGGRIIYTGAGTSGRLGMLDAVECPPTFGVDHNTVIGVMAGGENAFVRAREGAEDSCRQGAGDLQEIGLSSRDMVIGIAASGRTPYVLGALEYAMNLGCATAAIVCNAGSPIAGMCPDTIELLPGPEVLTGSTRLKAGTATKMVLNMISTISMTGLGKIYGNYMVDVKMTNEKLVSRGLGIVCAVTGASHKTARKVLAASGNEVKTAIVMILAGADARTARQLLADARGHIEGVLSIIEKQRNRLRKES